MSRTRAWVAYPANYRAVEVQLLTGWVQSGISGAVVGSAGSGKSNLLGFFCHRPDVLPFDQPADPIVLIPVDANNLPENDLATLYRTILRSFYEMCGRFEPNIQQQIMDLYLENRPALDPFLPYSALRELLLSFQSQGIRIVLVIDRFDRFCENASPLMADTLRGLRDSFKDVLSYIVGMRREIVYFADREALGELYELLDSYTCWMQPMADADARWLIRQEVEPDGRTPAEPEIGRLLALSGYYPALLKAAVHWWLLHAESSPLTKTNPATLLDFPAIRNRLEQLWHSLTLAEQAALPTLHDPAGQTQTARQPDELKAVESLATRGLVVQVSNRWQIRSELLTAYVSEARRSPGTIWLDEKSDMLHQGRLPLEQLTPLERSLLHHLIRHPYIRHSHTALIEATWPENTLKEGVTTEALYQVVRGLRRKIEPDTNRPRYVVGWRGAPEGGYRCFPEGRPA